MNTNLSSFLISIVVFGSLLRVFHGGELRKHFYKDSCPLAEDIVKEIIWKYVASNSTLPAKFLRMHFQDCFVNATTPNLSVGGFDVIDEVKTELEKTCPGVVSCVDIVTLAARDSVSYKVKEANVGI
ncbi:peroxidase 24 [Quercus suber]|uniref:peroxidase n=1 Tax=Quercus suber TaxID=58331 RepID=A0AAW0LHC7_QUESU